jgi:formylglycine-generating enzyme required for sulfatase activity
MTQAREIAGKDGAPMVLVPAGEFMMGSPDGEGDKDEHPRHKVALSAFYLDKYEVTNRFFQQFAQQTSYRTTAEQEGKAWALTAAGKPEEVSGAHWRKPEGGVTVFDSNREEHPVVSVSWEDAQAYCRWAGKRLATEAEFEYATRAGTETKYWWGNGNPGSRRVANIGDESAKRQYSDWIIMTGYDDGYVRTAPVGSFEANPFGLHDMTGNVWEWTADWYDEQYYGSRPPKNPKGPSKGDYKVFRGGSWNAVPGLVRSALRLRMLPSTRLDPYRLPLRPGRSEITFTL